MNTILNKLHIGTSGWSYRHWAGVFYPPNIKPPKFLEYYTTKFGCVELNSSFYHLPNQKTVAGWINRTPIDFRICPKLSRYITHQSKLVNCETSLQKFFNVLRGLMPKSGPVLIQLPPQIKYDKALISDFISLLVENYKECNFAIEVRNKSWITDEFFDLLSQENIAFVIADSGKRFPYYEAITSNVVYLRFHGSEHLYASNYSSEKLKIYAQKVYEWMKKEKDVWVFFNNDYQGFAPNNALKLFDFVHTYF